MFGLIKKELLDQATKEIIDLKRQLTEIKQSAAYTASLHLEDLKLEIKKLGAEKSSAEEKINSIKEITLKEIEENIKAEVDFIRKKTISNIEHETKSLLDEKNKVEEILKNNNNTLTEINEKIVIAQQELDSILNKIDITEASDTINQNLQDLHGNNSTEIKKYINNLKEQQKNKIAEKTAWAAYNDYLLNGSLADGKSQQKRLGNFLLSAFNAHADNIITQAKRGNFYSLHKKIELYFEKINKIAKDHYIVIERDYLLLRLAELRAYCKYHTQAEIEKEEERHINELIKEEAIVQKEIEAFIRRKEQEESRYSQEILKINKKIHDQGEKDSTDLRNIINELEQKIAILQQEKQRAMSLAQLTRSGHIYIISNKESFGPNIFKIGMTRRLDPMDRVRELGDASVPFFFDVHGIIHTDDAPTLEKELHNIFREKRVNKNNYRREFFRVSIEEIEEAICKIHGHISLDRKI